MRPDGVIEVVDPRSPAVRALLARHHDFVHQHSPPQDIHALDESGLLEPSVTLYGFSAGSVLLGIGALKELGDGEGELKSMHTLEEARGRGVAGALVDHILGEARARGLQRVSLETGSMAAFASAWSVYASRGFAPCGAFGDYIASPNSRYMTLEL